MQWQALLAVVPALWSLVIALPVPYSRQERLAVSADSKLNDPLWEKYGLDASAEYKYFHEPGDDDILGHYDVRFFSEPVDDAERAETLTHMIRAYLDFFNENQLDTWIAHGTLLGWWWNGKVRLSHRRVGYGQLRLNLIQILPWDWDIDTQVPDSTLTYLADYYNHTVVTYYTPDTGVRREYLLDVNPWSRQRQRGQGLNIIDARWIDISTGLYIDITGLGSLDHDHRDIWGCKNFHKYRLKDVYPLRGTLFEGVPAKVPFRYDLILMEEYSEKALTATGFHE